MRNTLRICESCANTVAKSHRHPVVLLHPQVCDICGELKFCAPHTQYGYAIKRGKIVKTKPVKKANKSYTTRTGVKFPSEAAFKEVESAAMYAFQSSVHLINKLGLTEEDIVLQEG